MKEVVKRKKALSKAADVRIIPDLCRHSRQKHKNHSSRDRVVQQSYRACITKSSSGSAIMYAIYLLFETESNSKTVHVRICK